MHNNITRPAQVPHEQYIPYTMLVSFHTQCLGAAVSRDARSLVPCKRLVPIPHQRRSKHYQRKKIGKLQCPGLVRTNHGLCKHNRSLLRVTLTGYFFFLVEYRRRASPSETCLKQEQSTPCRAVACICPKGLEHCPNASDSVPIHSLDDAAQ